MRDPESRHQIEYIRRRESRIWLRRILLGGNLKRLPVIVPTAEPRPVHVRILVPRRDVRSRVRYRAINAPAPRVYAHLLCAALDANFL